MICSYSLITMKTQKHEILCLAPVVISLIKIIQETLQIIKLGLISVPKDRLEQFRASLHKRILNTVDRHSFLCQVQCKAQV